MQRIEARAAIKPDAPASSEPEVSVVMPVRNGAAHLDEAVESILSQTFSPLELLIVDDHSTDETPRYLAAWADADARVRAVACHGRGLVAALNTGLELARGSLVARMDADDVALPDRLLLERAFLRTRANVSVVGCLVESFPRASVREGYRIYERWLNALLEPDDIAREIFVESPLPHPTVMFPRDLVLAAGGYQDDGGPEDYDLWLRLHRAGHRFAKVPEVLHLWRDHSRRLTRVDPRYALEGFLATKAHHLARGPLCDRRAIVWGAGMIGRRLARQLIARDVAIDAFVDIDPKKIGRTVQGRPVISPRSVAAPTPNVVLLAAVGSRHARELIRRRAVASGWIEGESFLCTA